MALFGEIRRQYDRERIARKRAEYFKDKCCVTCGSTDRLELDHINPEEKISHCIWSWSEQRRLVELAKCQVLCYDCHKIKTKIDLRNIFSITDPSLWKHGTNNTYNNHKCRCDLCRAWRVSKYKRLGT